MGVRKCVICGQILKPTDETVPYKKRHAHIQCFNNVMKITTSEKRQKNEEKRLQYCIAFDIMHASNLSERSKCL